MNANQIKQFLQKAGWTENTYGHMTKVLTKADTSMEIRAKFSKLAVRIEKAYRLEPSRYDPKPAKQWRKMAGDYYANITTHQREDNVIALKVGSLFIREPKP